MEFFEQLLMNGTDVTFALLFIGLFVYSIKNNDERELKYQQTIEKNQQIIEDTVKALNGYEDLKAEISKLSEKMR